MRWGKDVPPEGEGHEKKAVTGTEDLHEGEEGAPGSLACETNDTDKVEKAMSSDGGREESAVRKASETLQPSKSLGRRKWTLGAIRKRDSSLPREAPVAEDKEQPDTGGTQGNATPRRNDEIPATSPLRAQPSVVPQDALQVEATMKIPHSQGVGEKDVNKVKLIQPEENSKPGNAGLTDYSASTARNKRGAPKHTDQLSLEKHEAGSPGNQKACRVCVRVRPESLQEISAGGSLCVDTHNASAGTVTVSGLRDRQHTFHFDHVFDQDATQDFVYRCTCEALLEKLMAGYSASVMAYGQTGAGKTYTMLGEIAERDFHRALTDPTTRGVVPRLLEALFERILRETKECNEVEGTNQHSTADSPEKESGVAFSIRASLVEVYNDNVRDLLAPTRGALYVRDAPCTSNIRVNNGSVLTEATEVPIATAQEAFALIYAGLAQRAHGTTLLNDRSSRSHAIFQLIIRRNSMTACKMTCSRLCLVDLAGSERVSKADSSGPRLREAQSINKSLLALGNVISALPQSQKKGQKTYVPYRDSKLTRLLQHSFGGHAFTVLLLCCSPHTYNVKETLSTLRFGDRAANLKSQPLSVEAIDPDLVLRRLQDAQTELRISQAQLRAYAVQTARQVDAIRMLQAYVPREVTLTDDEQALLKHALQELPVLTQQQRLQLHSAAQTGRATMQPAANRPLRLPAPQSNAATPGTQRRDLSSPKAMEYTQGQRRFPQDYGRAGRTGESPSARPRTAPYNPAPRPPTGVSQKGSPTARRPPDQKKVYAVQGGQPQDAKKGFPAVNEKDQERPTITSISPDSGDTRDAADASAEPKTPTGPDIPSGAGGENGDKSPATKQEDTNENNESEQQAAQSLSQESAARDHHEGMNYIFTMGRKRHRLKITNTSHRLFKACQLRIRVCRSASPAVAK